MTYKEFITQISQNINTSKKLVSKYSANLIELLNNILEKDDIIIPGFGKFTKKIKNKIKFQPDKEFIEEINQK